MSYKHINTFERGCIEALHKLGYFCRYIAKQLNRHHSSIAKELSKNKSNDYIANNAQTL